MMKVIATIVCGSLLVFGGEVAVAANGLDSKEACSPTNIRYCKKEETGGLFGGGESYSTYSVRCSNGTTRTITSWEKGKKWCVGKSSDCSGDQLKAAKKACN